MLYSLENAPLAAGCHPDPDKDGRIHGDDAAEKSQPI
jgi:hypothetical protein